MVFLKKNTISKKFALVFLLFTSIILFFVDILIGDFHISLKEILKIFFLDNESNIKQIIIVNIRIPTALMAIVVGGSLSLAGCLLQAILDNPLASPFSLGISAAAGFGAALSIVFPSLLFFIPKFLSVPISAFIFSLLASFIVYSLSSLTRGYKTSLILFGIAVYFAFQSLLSAIQYFASPEESQGITFWLFGSLSRGNYSKILIISTVIFISFLYSMKKSWILTSLKFNENITESLGVKISSFRLAVFLISSALTSVGVAFVGIIGFVGIISPHIARIIVKEDYRYLIPCSILVGAIVLQIASIFSKTLIPGIQFPIGIVTSVFCVPFFLFIIILNRKKIAWN